MFLCPLDEGDGEQLRPVWEHLEEVLPEVMCSYSTKRHTLESILPVVQRVQRGAFGSIWVLDLTNEELRDLKFLMGLNLSIPNTLHVRGYITESARRPLNQTLLKIFRRLEDLLKNSQWKEVKT